MGVVVINGLRTPIEHQQDVVDLMTAGIEGFVSEQPGFVSATLHRGLDREHVTEVVEWASEEAWRIARELRAAGDKDVQARPAGVHGDARLYEVVYDKSA